MAHRKRELIDALSIRLAIFRDRKKRWAEKRAAGSRRKAMLVLGAALSIGGVTEAFDQVQFIVQKNLDGVQVVRSAPEGNRVVAQMSEGLTGDSLYKLAGIAPGGLISRTSDLVDHALFADPIIPADFLASLSTAGFPTTLAAPAANASDIDFAMLTAQAREAFFHSIPFGSIIHEKAQKYEVDPALVAAVIEQESRFKPRARSHRGARGLMQLMPATGKWMGARDLYDPEQNIDAGVRYLKYLEERFDGNRTKILAAYNAGEGNVRKYGGVPPFRETRTYVKKVASNYERRTRELAEFEKKAIAEHDLPR
ncbi:MAG: lytic transglycosylase domain-containing protein [Thermoanaerobaculia bacterium]